MKREITPSRRAFLKSAGVLGVGSTVTLAGCTSGGSGDNGGGNASSGGNAKIREKYGLPELDYELEDSLNVFQWTDYWPSGTVRIFEKAYGVSVSISNFTSNEEMFSKLKAGGTGQFDVLFPSDYMVNILASQGMIQALELGKIPNWDNLEKRWQKNAPYDPGDKRYSAPYMWGTSGTGWHTDMVGNIGDSPSWDLMWNEKYKGQMTMLNDMRETIGASLKRLGYSLNTKDQDKITEAKNELTKQKPLLKTYTSVNMAARLQNKTASPVHIWNGDAIKAYFQLVKNGSAPIEYQVPSEGGAVWMDTMTITKEAAHVNAAYAFITFILNAKIAAKIANYVSYGSPNKAAKQYIDDSLLNKDVIYPSKSTLDKLEFIENIGQATQYYSQAWTEIQNA
jgi:spermidine/putrescine transport system substrate-binding protein